MALQNPFRALRHRNFRLLWGAEILRTSSQWMDVLIRGILVWELTQSIAQMALVQAVRALPLLVVGLAAGILADRLDRRRLLLASQGLNIIAHVGIAVLLLFGLVEMWQVYVTAAFVGFGMAINAPARQALLPSLVPSSELQAAVVLNTATLNIGQAIGPVIGGLAVGSIGLPGAFLLQAGMVAVASILIRGMDLPAAAPKPTETWRESALSGVRYLRRSTLLIALLAMSLVPMILVEPFRGIVPAITAEQLMADAVLTGFLMAVLGLGALASVLALATFPPFVHPWRIIVVGAAIFGASIAVFALSRDVVLTAVSLFVAGIALSTYRTLIQSLQLTVTEDAYRGRMSSLWVINRGMVPLGSLLLAALTTVWGGPLALAVMAAASTVLVAAGTIALRSLWRRY